MLTQVSIHQKFILFIFKFSTCAKHVIFQTVASQSKKTVAGVKIKATPTQVLTAQYCLGAFSADILTVSSDQ